MEAVVKAADEGAAAKAAKGDQRAEVAVAATVLGVGEEEEVGGIVVGAVMVEMVDVLAASEGAAENFLHDQAVQVVEAAADPDYDIAGKVVRAAGLR